MNLFLRKVYATVLKNTLVQKGDSILVAVSGGMDSVCLLFVLDCLKEEFSWELAIAHFNHKTRGEDSEEDARFVQGLGLELNLQTFVQAMDVQAAQAQMKTSFQDAARSYRYRFLEETRMRLGFQSIAVGHNADDQAETILMNFLRGSGNKGLGGMPYKRGNLIRPLLDRNRKEISDFVNQKGLQFREDKSNRDAKYLRNKVRNELIPLLEHDYNPRLRNRLLATGSIFRDEEDYWSHTIEPIQSRIVKQEAEFHSLNLRDFKANHPALQKKVLRSIISGLRGGLKKVRAEHIETVLKLIREGQTGKYLTLPSGLQIRVKDTETAILGFGLDLKDCESSIQLANFQRVYLKIPGITCFGAKLIEFRSEVLGNKEGIYNKAQSNQAFLDYSKTGCDLYLRYFKPGDRFVPLGMSGIKKLKCFFIDEKVTQNERNEVPILTTKSDHIIWVYGKRISQDYRVTPETQRVLRIEGVPVNN